MAVSNNNNFRRKSSSISIIISLVLTVSNTTAIATTQITHQISHLNLITTSSTATIITIISASHLGPPSSLSLPVLRQISVKLLLWCRMGNHNLIECGGVFQRDPAVKHSGGFQQGSAGGGSGITQITTQIIEFIPLTPLVATQTTTIAATCDQPIIPLCPGIHRESQLRCHHHDSRQWCHCEHLERHRRPVQHSQGCAYPHQGRD